eukprot:GHUV01041190.1.p1 GENE.GHUV01041190.1~~GHUV01041190.1.p1  ORF type:complete len:189 (+),score=24.54 GHUV01041190.1:309-875(+)
MQWPPLYGGGFLSAVGQLAAFYYVLGAVLHYVIPAIFNVQGIQEQPRKPGEVSRDAINSIGPIIVKAAIWTVVEQLHARGISKVYAGPVNSKAEVLYILGCIVLLDYLHDTWFYWTHRLLHWRPLYRWVHWEHHRQVGRGVYVLCVVCGRRRGPCVLVCVEEGREHVSGEGYVFVYSARGGLEARVQS